jgi:hypothetical protein
MFATTYNSHLAAIPDGQPKTEGIALGQTMANNILKLRSNDNSNNASTPYPDGTKPGEYRKTGMNPMLPGWGSVKPWVLTSGSQFRLSGPPALTSIQYAVAYNETKSLGARDSTTRTAQQSEDALFWIGGVTDLWFGVARELSCENNLNIVDNARLFALLSMTFGDAMIAGWDSKFTLGSWRPITAIRDGDLDGNKKKDTLPLASYNNGDGTYGDFEVAFLQVFTDTYSEIGYNYIDSNNKVTPIVMHPKYKDYLATMARWAKDGLISSDIIQNDQLDDMIVNNQVGAVGEWYSMHFSPLISLKEKVPEADYEVITPKSLSGNAYKLPISGIYGPETLFVSYSQNTEFAMKLFNWFMESPENYKSAWKLRHQKHPQLLQSEQSELFCLR